MHTGLNLFDYIIIIHIIDAILLSLKYVAELPKYAEKLGYYIPILKKII